MSKKKKNTYVITFDVLYDYRLFSACANTPMALNAKNGETPLNAHGFITTKLFPNPCAVDMAMGYEFNKKIMGKKIASTVIEYLDKDTNKPVVQLFPSAYFVFDDEEDFRNRLNHASRRNFQKEMEKRINLINKNLENTK